MKLEEIEVIIEKDGKVRLSTSGFSGGDCLEATEALENLLGAEVISRETRSEARLTQNVSQREKRLNIRAR